MIQNSNFGDDHVPKNGENLTQNYILGASSVFCVQFDVRSVSLQKLYPWIERIEESAVAHSQSWSFSQKMLKFDKNRQFWYLAISS